MKLITTVILFSIVGMCQSQLIKDDRAMVDHVKETWATANNDNYKEVFSALIKNCEEYLASHPETSIKNGILGYLFEMKAASLDDKNEILKAAEILVKNDKSVRTAIRAGQVLIEKRIDDEKGIEILNRIIPVIKDTKQYYDANLLLAAGEMHLKNYDNSIKYLRNAVSRDSNRVDAYKGLKELYSMNGSKDKLAEVSKKIAELETDPNINVDLSSFGFVDINDNNFVLGDFKGFRVAMVFFSFDCHYCKRELPLIKKLLDKYKDVKFVFINLAEKPDEIKNKFLPQKEFLFMKDQPIVKFNSLFDQELDITITPQVLLVDKNSIVKYDYRGFLKDFEEKFEKDISTLE